MYKILLSHEKHIMMTVEKKKNDYSRYDSLTIDKITHFSTGSTSALLGRTKYLF
jgi:hypothetical protein